MKWNGVCYWSSPVSRGISCPDHLIQKTYKNVTKYTANFRCGPPLAVGTCHFVIKAINQAAEPFPDWQLLPVGAICSRVFVLTRWGLWWRERSVLSPVKLPLNTANLLLTLPPWDVIQVRTFAWRTWLWMLLHSYIKVILLSTWQAIKQNTHCQITT